MKKLLLPILLILMLFLVNSKIYESPLLLDNSNIQSNSDIPEMKLKKTSSKSSAPVEKIDGIVTGKRMRSTPDSENKIKYYVYIKTIKGKIRNFETTEYNYNLLDKDYSVHYVLTGSKTYKLISYKAPDK